MGVASGERGDKLLKSQQTCVTLHYRLHTLNSKYNVFYIFHSDQQILITNINFSTAKITQCHAVFNIIHIFYIY